MRETLPLFGEAFGDGGEGHAGVLGMDTANARRLGA
jgi:hypothetical protein